MARILLLINPKSRSGAEARDNVREALTRKGHSIIIPEDEDQDANKFIIKNKHNADFIIVGGGDGSVNHVLSSLVETEIPLLVYPLGTANNFARHYNLTNNIDQLNELISSGKALKVDLGVVNGIYFLNVAGLGLSTEVNQNVSSWLKRHLGVLAFIITAFQMIFRMNPFRSWIAKNDEKEIVSKSWQISVCNGKHYGSGLTIKHNATLEDGKLHLLSTEAKSIWEGFVMIPSLFSGHYKRDQEVTIFSAEKISIRTRRKFRIDVDGDIKTSTPAEFSVVPKRLTVIVPEATAQEA